MVRPEDVADAIRPDTCLVSIMAANNEVGTLQPIQEVGEITRSNGVLLHTDATQAVGYLELDVRRLNVDLLSASAHKLYGPKGIGFLYVSKRQPWVRLKTAPARWWTRRRVAFGNSQCAGDRGNGCSSGTRATAERRRSAATSRACCANATAAKGGAWGVLAPWSSLKTATKQPESWIRRDQGKGARRKSSRFGFFDWLCVHEREGATIPRAAGNGSSRRSK